MENKAGYMNILSMLTDPDHTHASRNSTEHKLKKSTLMIFERHANLKYKYEIDISGVEDIMKNTVEYIANQLQEDLEYDQMSTEVY